MSAFGAGAATKNPRKWGGVSDAHDMRGSAPLCATLSRRGPPTPSIQTPAPMWLAASGLALRGGAFCVAPRPLDRRCSLFPPPAHALPPRSAQVRQSHLLARLTAAAAGAPPDTRCEHHCSTGTQCRRDFAAPWLRRAPHSPELHPPISPTPLAGPRVRRAVGAGREKHLKIKPAAGITHRLLGSYRCDTHESLACEPRRRLP